ncbi:small glutamine-rich tetratricopeptide repeat-containing protein beta-like [Dermatophagoides pteronyssinus]|uniref:Small glutamine-rich tetratricopeptide repeat-containing protein alpha-like n=1 Tax=Dermatophagoides pteronyssinus TaxID=6956 RepID=A0A6P6Y1L1_DERPT|nr:small glutamine-rich tetratricopeptide repeat-containing protein alpha-like [Dermatophagoides pteronyssinus]
MSNLNSNMKTRFVASFMQFLSEELNNDELSADSKESIEVAIQCLETAYSINPVDGTLHSKKPMMEIFSDYMKCEKQDSQKVVSEEDKTKANELKNEGNELMKSGKYQEALETYTKAIELDDANPIYYCNRAAAHSKLENHVAAIEDCKVAIRKDPNYSKAYCRMGLAYVNLKDHQRARDCYKKAVELDPSESNKNNLRLAEEKLQEEQAQFSNMGFGNLFNNPQLMNFASQIMSNPNMQNMFSQMLGSMGGMGQQPSDQTSDQTAADGTASSNPMESFLQVGQQFADQIRQANPELMEQLRSAMEAKKDKEDENPDKQEN